MSRPSIARKTSRVYAHRLGRVDTFVYLIRRKVESWDIRTGGDSFHMDKLIFYGKATPSRRIF